MRRPLLGLKNSTRIIGDRFLIEKIDTGTWSRIVSIDSVIALDWLQPGEGALYRVTPLPTSTSLEGTAYNNSVHSENPSTDLTAKDRVVVYERDSIIYLRALDSIGRWGREFRVSDSLDSVDASPQAYWQRPGANFHPSLAMRRDSTGMLVVWERLDRLANTISIEGRMFLSLPTASSPHLPTSTRFRVAPARSLLLASTAHAPSVVGLDGGYAVAYPSSGSGGGISISAIKPVSAFTTIDSLSTHHIRWHNFIGPTLIDSSYFPTLASANRYEVVSQVWEQETPPLEDSIPTPPTGRIVHLGYQQGKLGANNGSRIMYNMIAINFRPSQPPVIWISPTEHVSALIPDCAFQHPSIAVDSAWLGIAFHSTNRKRVVLRFRQGLGYTAIPSWRTQTYEWGSRNHHYDWPSLTHFPYIDSVRLHEYDYGDGISGGPAGGLAWYRINGPDSTSQQYLYRYGWSEPVRLENGQHPTLTLVTKSAEAYWSHSSILYRGDSTTRSLSSRPAGTNGVYYPAKLENSPSNFSENFYLDGDVRQVQAEGSVRKYNDPAAACPTVTGATFSVVFRQPVTIGPIDPPPSQPSVPPTFFGPTSTTQTAVWSVSDVTDITRTGLFIRSDTAILVRREIRRDSGLVAWLDSVPYDTVIADPHDILLLTELVRQSDGAVMWRDDTISFRFLGDDTLREVITVPSHLTDSGTVMFVRLRAVPSEGLPYDASGAFIWDLSADTSGGFAKRTRASGPRSAAPAKDKDVVTLQVSPNPAATAVTVTLDVHVEGSYRVGIYDALGRLVRQLQTLSAVHAGRFVYEVELGGVSDGFYLIRAEGPSETASVGFSVVR